MQIIFPFFDSTMILILPALALVLVLYAQARVKSTFAEYSKIPASSGLTSAKLAQRLLKDGGLGEVEIEHVAATAMAVMQLVRLLMLRSQRD